VKASIALAVLFLAACSGGQPDANARLTGIVRIGPIPGPCVVDQPCSRPAPGVTLVFSSGSNEPVSATSDAKGRYEVQLEPGRYRIRAVSHPSPASLEPTSVAIEGDRQLDFAIDSGVRASNDPGSAVAPR
jgi:hypothetical protein